MKQICKSLFIWVCCFCLLFCGSFPIAAEETADTVAAVGSKTVISDDVNYFTYYETYRSAERPEGFITLTAEEALTGNGKSNTVIGDKNAVVLDEKGEWCEWTFVTEKTGVYSLYPCYYPLPATGKEILLKVLLDGAVSYIESESMPLNRLWTDEVQEDGTIILKDSSGDDLRPKQVEKPRWVEKAFYDPQGLYSEPYFFYIEAGRHTIRFQLNSEALAISSLKIGNMEDPVSYPEYHERFTRDDLAGGDVVYLQAEEAIEKTSQILYPVYDRSSAATIPNDPYNIKLNTIGQNNWNSVGQAISWKVNVPEAGLYKIMFRAKQNYNSGMNSYRTLYINGEIPFKEAKNIVFEYNQGWQLVNVGGKNTYYIWLEPGDILTLECTSGQMSEVLRKIQQIVLDLNKLYRKIIVVTGSSPDIYRDYALEDHIPELLDSLTAAENTMRYIAAMMNSINGGKSTLAPTVLMAAETVGELVESPHSIPEKLSRFKSDIESLGSLINTLGEQPLELDYIAFVPSGKPLPKRNAGLFESVSFSIKKFFVSFVKDYSVSITEQEKNIDIWVATGRDQVQILKNMVDDSFTAATNVGVRMSLVDTGSNLIRATLAGKGPDVALMIPQDTPVNLAMRGMLVDLTDHVDDADISQFRSSALTPFYYNSGLYALPETESYDMLFYRTDIFEELELKVPETWAEFYSVIKTLQSNNLGIGIPEIDSANMGVSAGIGTFNKFLYQNGGKYYNDGLTATLFDTEVATEAFEKWVELYSRYGLDRSFDFFNRFRSGEMPVGISGFTTYNQLSEAAPEIRGLWDFALVPGTPREDGTVDHSESSAVTGCIVITAAEDHGVLSEAVEFVKWWTGSESQARYGRELEAVLGISARYATANLNSAVQLGWTDKEWKLLKQQGEWTVNPEQIPGNYVLNRALTSAFRAALNGKNTPSRSLSVYNKDICEEITRKREEFGLS